MTPPQPRCLRILGWFILASLKTAFRSPRSIRSGQMVAMKEWAIASFAKYLVGRKGIKRTQVHSLWNMDLGIVGSVDGNSGRKRLC